MPSPRTADRDRHGQIVDAIVGLTVKSRDWYLRFLEPLVSDAIGRARENGNEPELREKLEACRSEIEAARGEPTFVLQTLLGAVLTDEQVGVYIEASRDAFGFAEEPSHHFSDVGSLLFMSAESAGAADAALVVLDHALQEADFVASGEAAVLGSKAPRTETTERERMLIARMRTYSKLVQFLHESILHHIPAGDGERRQAIVDSWVIDALMGFVRRDLADLEEGNL